MISRTNYEIYFIDYFDGKLDKKQQEELFIFLKKNADLENEFNDYASIKTEADESIEFAGKAHLKKEIITIKNYKTYFVAFTEDDLNAGEVNEVERFLSIYPALKPELEVLKSSRLVADKNIIFDKKKSLRKNGKVIFFSPLAKRSVSIAAALILFALIYYFIHQLNAPQYMIANNKEKKIKNNNAGVHGKNTIPVKPALKDLAVIENPGNNNKKHEQVIPVNINKTVVQNRNEISLTQSSDSIHAEKETARTQSFKTDSGNNINNEDKKDDFTPVTSNEINNRKINLSDVFSDDDLKELGLNKNMNQRDDNKTNDNLSNLASAELRKLSRATSVKFEKQSDVANNSVTYAFSVGKKLLISHKSSEN